MNKVYTWSLRVLSGILLIGLIGLVIVMFLTNPAMEEAKSLLDEPYVKVEDNLIIVEPTDVQANFVFYPGAYVETEAYLVMADTLRKEGIRVYIVKMPLNLAVLNRDAFESIQQKYESDLPWYLGGHSLGGAMITYNDVSDVEGLIFLAAYSDGANDLSNSNINVLSITASKDDILDMVSFEKGTAFLPEHAIYIEIEGGNHANFAYYGTQRGDGDNTISRQRQHEIVTDYIIDFIIGEE